MRRRALARQSLAPPDRGPVPERKRPDLKRSTTMSRAFPPVARPTNFPLELTQCVAARSVCSLSPLAGRGLG